MVFGRSWIMPKSPFQPVGGRRKPRAGKIGLKERMFHGKPHKSRGLSSLVQQAASQRERQRLGRLQCEHSGAWICAVPSTLDGNDTVMRPRNFQVAVSMRLGLPVLLEEKSCSLCMQIIDVYGDHAACCSVSSDRIHRHNRVRNLVDRIAQEGMLSPIMEKKHILGDVDGRRPGDVSLPLWRANKGLAIDVAVTRLTLSSRSTLIMMKASKVLALSSRRWSSKLQVAQMRKDSKCYASCFVSQPSIKMFS